MKWEVDLFSCGVEHVCSESKCMTLDHCAPVSGMASVTQWRRPDSDCPDGNRENAGLPSTGVHPYGWTACVSKEAVS